MKFSELSLDDQRSMLFIVNIFFSLCLVYAPYKEDWVKMEEEEDPIRKDMLKDMILQRVREGSKKIRKMEKDKRLSQGNFLFSIVFLILFFLFGLK